MSWFDNVWSAIWRVIEITGEALLNAMQTFASAGIKSLAENGGMFLMDAALEAVKAAETNGGSGLDKLKSAKDSVVENLTTEGIEVVENAVNLAIELAVAQLKTDLTASQTPADPQ
ncbi:MAG: hypothetical protein GEU92_18980 [Alphaproteobacteria bacterium]|nr:hypothetical protein [Alphaproteobacteria bacterium]